MASHRKRLRLGWVDVLVFAVLIAATAYVGYRVDSVLEYRWDWSGIPGYLYRWDEEQQRWVANLLMQGLATTLRLALWGIALAAIIGVVFGIMRTGRRLFPRMLSRAYVELVRNIPPLVFVFIFYFFVSSQIMPLLGVEEFVRDASPGTLAWLEVLFGPSNLIPNVISGVLCLAMLEGAYVTEIVRAGIQSVPRTQTEAARSVGLSRRQLMQHVILPQAVQRVVPPLAGQFITLVKDSSIVSLISIQELTYLAVETAVSTTRLFEVWITVAALYFGLCFCCALLFNRLERRMAVAGQ
ncbi:MAG: amino acid ABC transporter permease [Bryobacterales bacterium]|nr:amino acid ABC transporter permease [Bryobacterales bacterium]